MVGVPYMQILENISVDVILVGQVRIVQLNMIIVIVHQNQSVSVK
jgi:hypothetical protein